MSSRSHIVDWRSFDGRLILFFIFDYLSDCSLTVRQSPTGRASRVDQFSFLFWTTIGLFSGGPAVEHFFPFHLAGRLFFSSGAISFFCLHFFYLNPIMAPLLWHYGMSYLLSIIWRTLVFFSYYNVHLKRPIYSSPPLYAEFDSNIKYSITILIFF